jgi:D-amino-acid dehydrogenase
VSEPAKDQELPVAVIGAGVIGLSIAFRLAREFPRVVLIDRAEPGMACSYGNAGHIATEQIFPLASPSTFLGAPRMLFSRNGPLSIRPAYAAGILPWLLRFAWACRPGAFESGTQALASLQERALESFATLLLDAGIAEQLHRRGHLILVENPRLARAAQKQMAQLNANGIDARWIEAAEVASRAPGLKENIGAIHVLGSAHVADPLSVSRGLLEAFIRAGGDHLHDEVLGIEIDADGIARLTLSNRTLRAGRLIIAAGAWSRTLAAQTGFSVPLDTERGYHVQLRGWRSELDIAVASMDRMTIMTPLESGLRMTGFVELGGMELAPDPARAAILERHISELLPQAPTASRESWMGFRPSLPDHLPVIGRHPKNPRIVYAFGHQHLGLTLAGITADAVHALAAGREAPVDLNPFRIQRFS